jgi:hypothetical protein
MTCTTPSARRKAAFGSLLPLLFLCCALPGAQSAPALAAAAPLEPRVRSLVGTLAPDESIDVTVDNLGAWAVGSDPAKLVPYLDGLALRGNYPAAVDRRGNTLTFHLHGTLANRPVWTDLLGAPPGWRKHVRFSVGLQNDTPFATDLAGDNSPFLVIILPWYGVISLCVIVATISIFLWLTLHTNLIRDSGPEPLAGGRKAYNLGKAQIAFWFLLTFISYVAIWLITDEIDTITPGLLALMGISSATALGEVLIDTGKDTKLNAAWQSMAAEKTSLEQGVEALRTQLAALAPAAGAADDAFARNNLNNQLLQKRTRLAELVQAIGQAGPVVQTATEGFFKDILSDGEGYSFHRFQIVMWSIALGGVFVSKVYNNLTMPEFSATLLGLMGMSSGTYIALKVPEKR